MVFFPLTMFSWIFYTIFNYKCVIFLRSYKQIMDTLDKGNSPSEKPRDKISFLEFVFLLDTFLCFLVAILCLLQESFLLSLVFIILHGCLVPITLLVSRKKLLTKESDSSSEDITPVHNPTTMELIEHDNSLITRLRKEKDQLSY